MATPSPRKALQDLITWFTTGDKTGNPYMKPPVKAAIVALTRGESNFDKPAKRPSAKVDRALYDLVELATNGDRKGNPYMKPAVKAAIVALGGDGIDLPTRRPASSRSNESHARKKKITPQEAKQLLQSDGIDFRRDFHELSSSHVQRLLEVAKLAGYRKSKNAPGSTARMFFQRLDRLKSHATIRGSKDTHTVYDLYELNTITKRERTLHEHFSNKKDAKEAEKEYRDLKRPGFKYLIKPRKVARQPYRFNLED